MTRASRSLALGARAYERKQELIKVLAPDGCCAKCGTRPRTKSLEVDHVDGRDWQPRKLNRWARVARYWREHVAGVRLRALCRRCNAGHNPRKKCPSRRR